MADVSFGSGGCVAPKADENSPYAAQTISFAACKIDSLLDRADALKNEALQAIEEMEENGKEALIAAQQAGDYHADTDGVPQDYVPSTVRATEPSFDDIIPDPPKMPDPDEGLITPCESDAIFTRAKHKITKVNRRATHDALYRASRMGIGMSQPALHTALKEADLENHGRTVEAALEQAASEGQWRREDRKDLYELQARVYEATANGTSTFRNAETQRYLARLEEVKTHIQSEGERRGWSEMQMKDILEQAENSIKYAMEKVRAIIAAIEVTDRAVAELLATMAQGLYSAANVNVQGQGSYHGQYSRSDNYNYSGEISS